MNKTKKLIYLLVLSGALSACSEGEKEGPKGLTCETLTGHYEAYLDPSETLDIFADCTFTDSYCGYDASYTVPTVAGETTITVNGTNGAPGCMASIDHACTIEYNGIELAIDCDNGAYLYYFLRR